MQRLSASSNPTRLGLLLLAGSAAAGPLAVREKDQLGAGSSCDAAPGSLLADLQAHGAEAASFCSNYLCAKPSVAAHARDTAGTVSAAAHPMSLYGLQPLAPTQTPLTYDPSPTPSPVPGDSPACLGLPAGTSCSVTADAVDVKIAAAATPSSSLPACSSAPLPSFLAVLNPAPADIGAACSCLVSSSSSSTGTVPHARARAEDAPSSAPLTATTSAACTQITGSYPTMTIPAFCHPSQHVNAPRLAPTPAGLALATTTLAGMMSGKEDCCASCASVYNCVAWRFAPAYTQPPTPKLPGGFDPWGRGGCEIVYHTGSGDVANSSSSNNDTLAVCPNGRIPGLLDGGGSATRQWANVYYNGWNEGACGQPADAITNSQDPGVGDKDALCPGQLDE